jgi:ATP-dependent Clp protease ATP-binding subunit ClpA
VDVAVLARDLDDVLAAGVHAGARHAQAVKPESTLGFDRVVERAVVHAASSSAQQVESGALLVFLLQEEDSHAAYFLRKQGLDRLTLLRTSRTGRRQGAGATGTPDTQTGPRDPLEAFATDLVARAARGQIDPLIGRETRSSGWCRCSAAAARTTRCSSASRASARRRSPKAWRCASTRATCPNALKGARVFALDLGRARRRHALSRRLRGARQAGARWLAKEPNAILFIDEIHTLVGAGSASGGTMDAGNLLKPALASGALRCIGSTTFADVKQSFDKDRALSRRFQKIEVLEPSEIETVAILMGCAPTSTTRSTTG